VLFVLYCEVVRRHSGLTRPSWLGIGAGQTGQAPGTFPLGTHLGSAGGGRAFSKNSERVDSGTSFMISACTSQKNANVSSALSVPVLSVSNSSRLSYNCDKREALRRRG
jgi:hypothetical protein